MLFALIDKLLEPLSPLAPGQHQEALEYPVGGRSANDRLMSRYYDTVLTRRSPRREGEDRC